MPDPCRSSLPLMRKGIEMLRYIVKRILALIPVLFCVAFLIFTMMYFSRGDPATMTLGDQATEEQLAGGWTSPSGSSSAATSGELCPGATWASPIRRGSM